MGDDEDGGPYLGVHLADRGQHGVAGGVVQLAGRLVGKEHPRVCRDPHRERRELQLPGSERGERGIGQREDANEVENLAGIGHLAAMLSRSALSEVDVPTRRDIGQHVAVGPLQDDPDLSGPEAVQRGFIHLSQVVRADPDGPGAGAQQPAAQGEQGRLPGARRTEQPDDLS